MSSASMARRELYFLNWFRLAQALVYGLLAYGTTGSKWLNPDHPAVAQIVAIVAVVYAVIALLRTRAWLTHPVLYTSVAISLDILIAIAAVLAMHNARIGIAMMLMVNLAGAALVLPMRLALFFAAVAALGLLAQVFFATKFNGFDGELLESALFGIVYLAASGMCNILGRQMRASEELAQRRGLDLANLAQVNELIIRRMKTGVLLVDDGNQVHQFNESAWMLLGSPPMNQRDLGTLAPELSRRLFHWRHYDKLDETAIALAEGVPEVVPRFTRLAANDDSNILIFLDDTSLVSRRAEELTLASLGRLSASIAHEIRNPLAAIRYSAQLLAESEDLVDADQRMVEIINNHCSRLNEIIENILQLSRRERSRPETLDLNAWALDFVEEYSESNDLGSDSLRAIVQPTAVEAVIDPQHLQQVIWNLVQNALRYGRMPGEPARVMLISRAASDAGPPLLEVVDRGPGIPTKVAAQIFEPFYTTHEYGTGLGLYLCKQMCDANQAELEYVPVAGGGSCFRITLAPPAQAPVSSDS
ncbi:HAMP domain-containing sensor histidine kinase [Oleiagrimonas sp. MCCC 1A03011]|uniref:sensor histidine kinase n=1 Tax=Oleiagrimonas sp. MCCC 1A03011 TaxID=1926883 RepID=UPI000DC42CBF|nr:HAMP domain-containing sensor histidine kinase [Oleiagrimonas sp. MCCC 1A03011]RAP59487.1 two-component sensor histidine kinase [Oleiagrimonas sp. MCCC 1A03011]